MPVEVILPKVDMDMATGQISRWFVGEGAAVKQGDVLFEIETDKAAMEIDAPASGTIRNISGREGIDIPVGQVVAWIFAEGEDAGTAPAVAKALPAADRPQLPASQERVVDAGPPAATPAQLVRSGGSARATPLARRLAREAGLDISAIEGSGPKGRVVKADIEAFVQSSPSGRPAAARSDGGTGSSPASAPPASDDAVLKLFEEGSYGLVPHDSMRRTIARRLVEAKSTIPHFYLTLDCELDALLKLRGELNAAAPTRKTDAGEAPAYRLSVNDFVIKAYALALRDVPAANVSWTEANMVQHRHADIGVAVSVPGGLITPIVRRAEEKTLTRISAEMKDMAARARDKKLRPEEYQGGSGAVSNLGMFGIRDFAAVINPPHATILAVGAGEERAVVKNGSVAVATMMSVTLSTDHRAVDGALGAELLGAFKRHIENPMGMLV